MSVAVKELLLLYITLMGFASYVPQIIKIRKTRSSKDCSISSWFIWSLNSFVYLLYLILSTENIWLILSQALEFVLIFGTFLLVVIFRKERHIETDEEFQRRIDKIRSQDGNHMLLITAMQEARSKTVHK